jgi:hypothetical protein
MRKSTPDEAAAALQRALEHVDAATKHRAVASDRNSDEETRVTSVLAMHAHVKAADGYFESARSAPSLPLPSDDHGGGGEVASDAALSADPEERSIRQATRASAAAVLVASGNTEGAQRLLRTPPEFVGAR